MNIIASEGKEVYTLFEAQTACPYDFVAVSGHSGPCQCLVLEYRPPGLRGQEVLVSLFCAVRAKQVLLPLGLQTLLKSQIAGDEP